MLRPPPGDPGRGGDRHPKTREGQVEMIRLLPVARRGAMKARVAAAEQLYGVLCSAPEELRQPLLGSRPRPSLGPVRLCGRATHQHHRRHQDHPVEPGPALATAPGRTRPARPPAPSTGHLGRPHPGRPTRGRDRDRRPAAGHRRRQPQRLRSEAAFAHLCGTAPIPASSGRTDRHRLNRGGDRRANNALWRITLVRMRCHPPTRAYVQRRTNQGLSKLDIMRCWKRYIAREIYHQLTSPPPINPPACLK